MSIIMHIQIRLLKIMTFWVILKIFDLPKSCNLKKIGQFWIKQDPFIPNFAKQPNIFSPKVLRIIVYP